MKVPGVWVQCKYTQRQCQSSHYRRIIMTFFSAVILWKVFANPVWDSAYFKVREHWLWRSSCFSSASDRVLVNPQCFRATSLRFWFACNWLIRQVSKPNTSLAPIASFSINRRNQLKVYDETAGANETAATSPIANDRCLSALCCCLLVQIGH